MNTTHLKGKKRRSRRVKVKIRSTGERPRLSVFRSNRYIYAQLINDEKKATLASVNEREFSGLKEKKLTKSKRAKLVGQLIAEKAKEGNIKKVIFDRNGYRYHGRIKNLAEGARESGLKF